MPAPTPALAPVPAAAAFAAVTPRTGLYDGEWGEVTELPVIPVAVAVLPSGKLLMWSAYTPDDYQPLRPRGGDTTGSIGRTEHAIFDPATGEITPGTVTTTNHDMFCPGIAMLPSGDIMITGGSTAERTSFFRSATETWEAGPDMQITRGYQTSVTLANGDVRPPPAPVCCSPDRHGCVSTVR